jgi:hypothetical protein
MHTQLLQALITALCKIAGSKLGAVPRSLYLKKALRHIARPDEWRTPLVQGEQILEWLKVEIREWNSEIFLRGERLSVTQCKEVFRLLLNLDGLKLTSENRRLKAIDLLGLEDCGWDCWRRGVEAELLEYLARHLVELYPERVEGYSAK